VTDPLLIDISPHCPQQPDVWARLREDPRFVGAILKGGQGLRDCGRWVRQHAEAIRAAGIPLGYYWYLRLDQDGAAQADAFAKLLAEHPANMWPIVDVEEGGGDGRPSNAKLVKSRGVGLVERVTREFVGRLWLRTGLPTILYTGGWLRGLGLRSMLGCEYLWLSAFTPRLPAAWYELDLGCPRERLWAWQYMGNSGSRVLAKLAGYPRTSPIGVQCDISAVVMPDGIRRVGVAERPSVGTTGPGR
jgi:GH25 family lysozyme M1 (1,4-beta-N-acetylmuramidase)